MASDFLVRMMEAQKDLQFKIYGVHPADMMQEERIDYIKENVLGLTDELHELLNEMGWKSWATSRHLNREAAVGEAIDAWHLLMNIFIALGAGPSEIFDRYMEKRNINIARQRVGYDGVTGKCSACGRALDDPAVLCTPLGCSVNC